MRRSSLPYDSGHGGSFVSAIEVTRSPLAEDGQSALPGHAVETGQARPRRPGRVDPPRAKGQDDVGGRRRRMAHAVEGVEQVDKVSILAAVMVGLLLAGGLTLVLWVGQFEGSADHAVLEKLVAIERRLVALEDRLGGQSPPSEDNADLADRILALELAMVAADDGVEPAARRAEAASGGVAAPAGDAAAPDASAAAIGGGKADREAVKDEVLGAVEERIDEAVEKRVDELAKKQNKKPSIDTFAELLELDEAQRQAVEEEVREGQWQIRDILETPMADGTTLLDELVDAMAYGQAGKPEAGARFATWWGRVVGETYPGTDQTYAARIEGVKGGVRDAFRRTLTDEQYSEFEEWRFDPTEMEDITGSAWDDFEERVGERAAELAGGQ